MKRPDWNNAPNEVWQLAIAKRYGIPIGMDTYNKTYKYPKYFPEECERKRKLDSVPERIMKMYDAEMSELWASLWNTQEQGDGLLALINNPEKMRKWEEEYDAREKIRTQREKEIHDKYLKAYGL